MNIPLAGKNFIEFSAVDVDFTPANEERHKRWLSAVATQYGAVKYQLSYIFCTDEYLHHLNVTHLQHDTLTDIITFPFAEGEEVAADICISLDRVRENALMLDEDFDEELRRVMVHGLLHLLGLSDKSKLDKQAMRAAENEALYRYEDADDDLSSEEEE